MTCTKGMAHGTQLAKWEKEVWIIGAMQNKHVEFSVSEGGEVAFEHSARPFNSKSQQVLNVLVAVNKIEIENM